MYRTPVQHTEMQDEISAMKLHWERKDRSMYYITPLGAIWQSHVTALQQNAAKKFTVKLLRCSVRSSWVFQDGTGDTVSAPEPHLL